MVSPNIIPVNVHFLIGKYECCKLLFREIQWVSSNIILINLNFLTIHSTGSNSAKVIKKYLGIKNP